MSDDLGRLLDELEAAHAEMRPLNGPFPPEGIVPKLVAELRRRDEALAAVRELVEELYRADVSLLLATREEREAVGARRRIADRIRAVLAAHEQAEATP